RKGVRTVQRYERHMALPVRRPAGNAQGSVLATRAELDAWVRAQPCREALQLKRPIPNISTPAFRALKNGVASMRRLHEEMSELREELRASVETLLFFFKQKTAYEIGLGIPAEPLFRSDLCLVLLLAVLLLLLLVAPCLNCLEAVKKPPPVAFKVMCLLPITIL